MIKHKGGCHCGEITFSTEYDPMLKGLCNCTRCRKIFGTVNAGVMFGEPEVEVSGELKKYTASVVVVCQFTYTFVQNVAVKYMVSLNLSKVLL